MNKLRNLCATFVLVLAFCSTALADDGIMGTGGKIGPGGSSYTLLFDASLSIIGGIIARL